MTSNKIQINNIDGVLEYNLPIEMAIESIKEYYSETVRDHNGRYMSWRHCYNAFSENKYCQDERTKDYLCLHLAFYLASWGMYRGSSFLLQKDYKIHMPIVEIILRTEYKSLWGISAEELIREDNLRLLDDVSKWIHNAYAEQQPSFESRPNNATETLVTKILLGTLGCVPAYDRYYLQTLKKYKITRGVYCKKSVKDVAEYYIANKEIFEPLRLEINKSGTVYPQMKMMDMCMWQIAYNEDPNE